MKFLYFLIATYFLIGVASGFRFWQNGQNNGGPRPPPRPANTVVPISACVVGCHGGRESCPDCCQRLGYVREGSQCRTIESSTWRKKPVTVTKCYCAVPVQGRSGRRPPAQNSSPGKRSANGKRSLTRYAATSQMTNVLPFRRNYSNRNAP